MSSYVKLTNTFYMYKQNIYIIYFLKKYFFKNGVQIMRFKWLDLYYLIYKFDLLFKYSFNYSTKKIIINFIEFKESWRFKLLFLKKYFKLIRGYKFLNINLTQLFYTLQVLNKNILKNLIE